MRNTYDRIKTKAGLPVSWKVKLTFRYFSQDYNIDGEISRSAIQEEGQDPRDGRNWLKGLATKEVEGENFS